MSNAASNTEMAGETDDLDDSPLKRGHEEIRFAICRRIDSLTSRQRQVLQLLSEGRTNKFIAWRMSITPSTVKSHVSVIVKILGCANRTEAALLLFVSSHELSVQAQCRVRKLAFDKLVREA